MVSTRNNRGLIILVILGLLIVLGLKKPMGGGGGAPAVPSGSIATAVTLTQVEYAARSHLVVKHVGDTVNILVSWTGETKNGLGQPISWNYGISWRYQANPTGAFRFGGFFNIGSRPNGTFSFGASNILDSTFFPGNWNVQVTLHADNSDANGQPLNDMPILQENALVIANGSHINAFQVV